MRPETVGIFACLGGYAITGSAAPASPRISQSPTSLRPLVPLGSVAMAWRAKELLEAAQMDWQEAQEITAPAPDTEWEEWEIAQVLEGMRVSPSLVSTRVQMTITGVCPGEPHRASLDEMDYELFESLQGDL